MCLCVILLLELIILIKYVFMFGYTTCISNDVRKTFVYSRLTVGCLFLFYFNLLLLLVEKDQNAHARFVLFGFDWFGT